MLEKHLTSPEARRRIVRFLVVGGGSALVHLGLLALLKRYMNVTLAYCIGWMLSTVVHYLANRFWALPNGRRDTAKQLGEYLFTIGLSFVINLLCFRFCMDVLGFGPMWASILGVPPATAAAFLLLNYRVFRAPSEPGSDLR